MQRLSGIEAVFFDVGSTLLEPDPPVEAVFAEIVQSYGYDLTVDDVQPHMGAVDEFYEAEYLKDGDFWADPGRSVQIWLDMYEFLSFRLGLEEHARAIASDVYREYAKPSHWKPYPDVVACLKALKRAGKRLAIVSNWDPALTGIIQGLGLGAYFEEITSSADVGYRKPDPEIFRLTLERMQLDPAHAIHVGDIPEADGDGASSAGITPVIIDRECRLGKISYISVNSLLALPEMVC